MVYNWADVGGFRFEGSAEAEPFYGGVLSGLSGWRGLPGARGDALGIPGGHGTFDRRQVFREGRSIELRGGIMAETPEGAAQLLTDLETLVGSGPVLMQVGDATGMWEREVEVLNLALNSRWINSRFALTVDMYAPDPVRYRPEVTAGPVGVPESVGGLALPDAFPWFFGSHTRPEIVLVNDGTVAVHPVAVVVGSASSVVVRGGARALAFGAFAGELVLDSRNRRAWLNGADVTRQLIERNWHEVTGGTEQPFRLEATGAAAGLTLVVKYKIGAW